MWNFGDVFIEEYGFENVEFNNRYRDWVGYDFVYKIVLVYELWKLILLVVMRGEYGFKFVFWGLVCLL